MRTALTWLLIAAYNVWFVLTGGVWKWQRMERQLDERSRMTEDHLDALHRAATHPVPDAVVTRTKKRKS